jgi:putative oxidoreductase
MDIGRLALRGIVGPLMVGHGTQKLFGWFGGHGLEGTGGFFETLGLRPGRRHATAAGAAEALGGALLALGALTPAASALISGSMITAIRKVHAQNGPWATKGGYEYNLVLIGAMIAITEAGPGRPSVDEAAFPRLKGTAWALLALGAAAAGSFLATERFSEPEPGAQDGRADVARDPAFEREPRFSREPAQAPEPADQPA